jgi:hypothetical protein
MEGQDNKERRERKEIFSRVIRAGKKTYFFDVKATRGEEFYLTITESRKHFSDDGKFYYEKNKIFLYKEDFEKFTSGLNDVIHFIETGEKPPESYYEHDEEENSDNVEPDFNKSDSDENLGNTF